MKRIIAWVGVFLCVCLLAGPLRVSANSTDQANEFIDTSRKCTLTLWYTCGDLVFPGVTVDLYQIAVFGSDFQLVTADAFADCNLTLNGITSQDEWNAICSTLQSYIAANPAITPRASQQTDEEGKVVFRDLEPGLYLTMPVQITQDGFRYYFAAMLSTLPAMDENNNWLYEVEANCKPDVDNPTGQDIPYQVIKLWKDDGNGENRTESITVDIIKDGETVRTVVLSDENNWSYAWYAPDDGSVWSVMERDIPEGYTMTVEKHLTTFTVINSTPTPPPPSTPQTGDTAHIGLYVILMCISGTALILLTSRLRRYYE